MTNPNWVTRFEQRRQQFIQAFGGFTVDFNGILGAILPYILVVSLLYSFIFTDIIPNEWLRLTVALIAAFIVEGYAIAVMVLDQQVQAYNALGETPIRYHAGRAKLNYLILVGLIVLFGHVLPELFGFPREIAILSLLPMLLISWYGYEMFSVNYTLRERLAARAKREEDERLTQTTQAFADRGRLESEAVLKHEERLLEEARAKQEEAKAAQAKAQVALVREERKKVIPPPTYEVTRKSQAHVNGASKPWDERSFAEIEATLQAGEKPPEIKHLDTWQRYLDLCDNLEFNERFDIKAAYLCKVNTVRFRKDLKLLAAHRLVREVGRGAYVLVEPHPPANLDRSYSSNERS
jgi:hypothetical protein